MVTRLYKYSLKDVHTFKKHGVDLTVYPSNIASANIVHISVEQGHFEEFYDIKSTYMYYILEGSGIFYLNDEKVEVVATDLVVAPPNTRIYYFGKMEIVLTVTPAFDEKNERHVRYINEAATTT